MGLRMELFIALGKLDFLARVPADVALSTMSALANEAAAAVKAWAIEQGLVHGAA